MEIVKNANIEIQYLDNIQSISMNYYITDMQLTFSNIIVLNKNILPTLLILIDEYFNQNNCRIMQNIKNIIIVDVYNEIYGKILTPLNGKDLLFLHNDNPPTQKSIIPAIKNHPEKLDKIINLTSNINLYIDTIYDILLLLVKYDRKDLFEIFGSNMVLNLYNLNNEDETKRKSKIFEDLINLLFDEYIEYIDIFIEIFDVRIHFYDLVIYRILKSNLSEKDKIKYINYMITTAIKHNKSDIDIFLNIFKYLSNDEIKEYKSYILKMLISFMNIDESKIRYLKDNIGLDKELIKEFVNIKIKKIFIEKIKKG